MDYQRIESAIRFVEERSGSQPTLDEVAAHVGVSPFHLQRLFQRWAGLSPKRFLQFLTAEHAKQLLRESRPVLETAFEVGLSGSSRLHDLLTTVEAVTPGEYKGRGAGIRIDYGFGATPFGEAMIAWTDRGICHLGFTDELDDLRDAWPNAEIVASSATDRLAAAFDRRASTTPLLLRGTNFQIKVWHALLRIPEGSITTYGELAEWIGQPTATRAVASAIARNPIGYLIPCHRALRRSGRMGGYRWGTPRKLAMLARESVARSDRSRLSPAPGQSEVHG